MTVCTWKKETHRITALGNEFFHVFIAEVRKHHFSVVPVSSSCSSAFCFGRVVVTEALMMQVFITWMIVMKMIMLEDEGEEILKMMIILNGMILQFAE